MGEMAAYRDGLRHHLLSCDTQRNPILLGSDFIKRTNRYRIMICNCTHGTPISFFLAGRPLHAHVHPGISSLFLLLHPPTPLHPTFSSFPYFVLPRHGGNRSCPPPLILSCKVSGEDGIWKVASSPLFCQIRVVVATLSGYLGDATSR